LDAAQQQEGREVGEKMEALVLEVLEQRMFFGQLESVEQAHLSACARSDDGRGLSAYVRSKSRPCPFAQIRSEKFLVGVAGFSERRLPRDAGA